MTERFAGRPGSGPAFSVVMPVYNKVRHVEAAIRSVLSQAFGDFELIVVDDASTDGSSDVLAAVESSRMRRLRRDVPGPGGYAARNLGISVASGAWITFLDADDTWNPDHLERLWSMIGAFPQATVHACAWRVTTRQGVAHLNKYARRNAARGPHTLTLAEYLDAVRRDEPPIHTDTVAIRADALPHRAVFPADLAGTRGGDVFAWLRLMCRERLLAWSPHVGANYYVDSDNMVTKREPSTAAFLTKPNVQRLGVELSSAERALLHRAVNTQLFRAWLGNVTRGRGGFYLPSRLFWRGTGCQAFAFAATSLLPSPVILGARRIARLSPRRG